MQVINITAIVITILLAHRGNQIARTTKEAFCHPVGGARAKKKDLAVQLVNIPLRASKPKLLSPELKVSGEPWRARTSDPLIKSQLLYQLS